MCWLPPPGRPPAAMAQGPGPRLDHCRIRHVAARHLGAHAARGLGRQAERPHRRNPAADRAQPAFSGRSQGARRAPDHHRLRRHPGRRRYPHCFNHRRLDRALRLPRLDENPRHGADGRVARSYRGDFLRRVRWRGSARSRLRRGFASRHRRQFRPHRHRQYRGNTGHRRENAVLRGAICRAVGTGTKASASWSICRRWQSDDRRRTTDDK